METRLSIILYWIIWKCLPLHLCSKEYTDAVSHCQLRPTNISVKTRGTDLLLSWACDVPEVILDSITYEIHRKTYEDWDYVTETKGCSQEITLDLSREALPAVCLKVIPVVDHKELEDLSSEEICVDFERNGTSAENVSCTVYNASSMICKWTFGKSVPHNTTYTLSLKQETTNLRCQQYENDLERRTGSCTLHDLTFHFFKDVTITLKGSSLETQIFEDQFKPAKQEMFNPPTNITVSTSGEIITIHWKSPQKQYQAKDECFEYIIEKNKELYIPTSNPYTITNIEKECLVRIRARGTEKCQMNTNWGQWSEMKACDIHQNNLEKTVEVALISAIVVSGLIIVLLIISTMQYKRVLHVCFPRIPQPNNYFDSIQDLKINTEQNECVYPILPIFETEEYILCLQENNP